jgi:hypothetical protein
LAELLEKAGEGDFLRAVAEPVPQLLMESDVKGLIEPGATSAAASARLGATATATAPSTYPPRRAAIAHPQAENRHGNDGVKAVRRTSFLSEPGVGFAQR